MMAAARSAAYLERRVLHLFEAPIGAEGLARRLLRWLLAAAFSFVGYVHITRPGVFLPIVPDWVPLPRETIVATGMCEIAGAFGLMVPRLRRFAGIMLALYSVCVYPANIKHAIDHVGTLGWSYHAPRLLFQPVIIWWCLWAGRVIDWPLRRRA